MFPGSLQVLAASEPLHDVLSSTSGNPPPEGTLTTPFVRLMREIYGSQSDQSLNPRELYNTFVKKFPYFKPYTQQDAQEFLRFLLEGLKSEVPPPPNAADAAVRPTMKRTRRRTLVPAGTEEIGAPDSNALNESQGTYIDHVFGGKLGSYVVCDICKSVFDQSLNPNSRYPRAMKNSKTFPFRFTMPIPLTYANETDSALNSSDRITSLQPINTPSQRPMFPAIKTMQGAWSPM